MSNVNDLDNLQVIHVQWSDFELKESPLIISLFYFVRIVIDVFHFLNLIEAELACHNLVLLSLIRLETYLVVI